jgi:hypothetical protein
MATDWGYISPDVLMRGVSQQEISEPKKEKTPSWFMQSSKDDFLDDDFISVEESKKETVREARESHPDYKKQLFERPNRTNSKIDSGRYREFTQKKIGKALPPPAGVHFGALVESPPASTKDHSPSHHARVRVLSPTLSKLNAASPRSGSGSPDGGSSIRRHWSEGEMAKTKTSPAETKKGSNISRHVTTSQSSKNIIQELGDENRKRKSPRKGDIQPAMEARSEEHDQDEGDRESTSTAGIASRRGFVRPIPVAEKNKNTDDEEMDAGAENVLWAEEELDIRNEGLLEIPEVATLLPNLQRLLMSGNKCRILPSFVTSFVHLTVLDAANNDLDELPENIGALTELRILRLENNNVKMLPDSMGDLYQLEVLDISRNALGALPPQLVGCSALKDLRADLNPFISPQVAQAARLGHVASMFQALRDGDERRGLADHSHPSDNNQEIADILGSPAPRLQRNRVLDRVQSARTVGSESEMDNEVPWSLAEDPSLVDLLQVTGAAPTSQLEGSDFELESTPPVSISRPSSRFDTPAPPESREEAGSGGMKERHAAMLAEFRTPIGGDYSQGHSHSRNVNDAAHRVLKVEDELMALRMDRDLRKDQNAATRSHQADSSRLSPGKMLVDKFSKALDDLKQFRLRIIRDLAQRQDVDEAEMYTVMQKAEQDTSASLWDVQEVLPSLDFLNDLAAGNVPDWLLNSCSLSVEPHCSLVLSVRLTFSVPIDGKESVFRALKEEIDQSAFVEVFADSVLQLQRFFVTYGGRELPLRLMHFMRTRHEVVAAEENEETREAEEELEISVDPTDAADHTDAAARNAPSPLVEMAHPVEADAESEQRPEGQKEEQEPLQNTTVMTDDTTPRVEEETSNLPAVMVRESVASSPTTRAEAGDLRAEGAELAAMNQRYLEELQGLVAAAENNGNDKRVRERAERASETMRSMQKARLKAERDELRRRKEERLAKLIDSVSRVN